MQKIFDVVVHFVDEIKQFFLLIGDAVSSMAHLVTVLPTWMVAFATATLTILIIMQVLGRGNSGD